MAAFSDAKGRAWNVVVTIPALFRIKETLGIDLITAISDGSIYATLAKDPILLCNVLYVLCKPQADALRVSDEDFGTALVGDAIEDATNALIEALVVFFPSRRRRLQQKAKAKLDVLMDMAMTAAEKQLDSDELERKMQSAIEKTMSGE